MSEVLPSQQMSLDLPASSRWSRSPKKNMCSRDPTAGPGTCWYWWDGCPDAERRNCYLKHATARRLDGVEHNAFPKSPA